MKTESNLAWLILLFKWLRRIEGRTRLQKLVYLLKENGVIDFSYRFVPYFFGPYSSDLQNDVNLMASLGVIDVRKSNSLYVHQLTDKGTEVASRLEERLPTSLAAIRREVKAMSDKSTYCLVAESKRIMASRLQDHVVVNLWK